MKTDNSYNKTKKYSKKAPKGGDTSQVDSDKFAHIQPIQAIPLEVKVYNNNFDKALRAFRALVQKERIMSIYKERQSYEKSSDKKRRKRNERKRKLFEFSNEKKNSKNNNKEYSQE